MRHSNKHIQQALEYAQSKGWRIRKSSGKAHAWGVMYCPQANRDGCKVSILSTPRNAEKHARHLRREVDICPHQ